MSPVLAVGIAVGGFAVPASATEPTPPTPTDSSAATTSASSDAAAGTNDTSTTPPADPPAAPAAPAPAAQAPAPAAPALKPAPPSTPQQQSLAASAPATTTLTLKADVAAPATQGQLVPQVGTSAADGTITWMTPAWTWDTATAIDSGTYHLSELPGTSGQALTGLACVNNADQTPTQDPATAITTNAKVTIAAGQSVTCTFTNAVAPKKTLKSNGVITPQAVTTTVINITKGGARSDNSITGLGGATFDAYAGAKGGSPSGGSLGTCTTSTAGTCTINVTADSPNGYWIVETTAPAGWAAIGSLGTGDYNNAKTVTPYRYHVQDGGTRNVPADADGPLSGDSVMQHSGTWANVATNPDFPQKCGLNIAMVFDTSGSISSGEMTQFKNAAKAVVGDGVLGGTPSTISMYRFSTTASTMATGIGISTAAGIQTAVDKINTLPASGSGYTNWDAGMRQVASDGGYDVVLFLTDGDPTTYGSGADTNTNVQFKMVEQGVFSANQVKEQTGAAGGHTKIVGVGVGLSTNSNLNLEAITGPNLGDDYYLANDFPDLQTKLNQIATKNCGGTLTVVKETQDASGNVISDSASGWDMTATGDVVDGSPAKQTTGVSGTNFTLTFPDQKTHTVSVVETPQTGFTYYSSSCNVTGAAPITGSPGFTVPVTPLGIVSCKIINRQVAQTHVVVQKSLSPTTDPGRFDLQFNGTTVAADVGNGGASPAQLVKVGDAVTTAELAHSGSDLANYTSTLACDNGVVPNPNAGTSGAFTVPASALGKTITCTFTNTRLAASVIVNKTWTINGVDYANGAQPAGYASSLALTNQQSPAYAHEYTGYAKGQTVTIGETPSVPTGCTDVATGDIGARVLTNAGLNTFSIHNAVTCGASLQVDKKWVINGDANSWSNTHLPTGYTAATLTLSGGSGNPASPQFGVTYTGYTQGDKVIVGEASLAAPSGCVLTTSGDSGTHTLAKGANSYTITNTVTCVATVTVNKDWTINGVPFTNDDLPSGFTKAALTLTGQTSPSFGHTYDGYTQGDKVTVGEQNAAVPTGCTLTSTGDQITYTLNKGDNVYQISNVVLCTEPTLKLVKAIDGADAALNVHWTVKGTPTDSGSGSPTLSGAGSTAVTTVNHGVDYSLSESSSWSGAGEFSPEAWVCVDSSGGSTTVRAGDPGKATLGGLKYGQAVVCTITNKYNDQGVDITKTVNTKDSYQNADGTWTTTYDVAVTNNSSVASTTYSLTDTLEFGGGITVNSVDWVGPTTSGSWVLPTMTATLATGATIAASKIDTYVVTVVSTVSQAAWDNNTAQCTSSQDPPSGFLNAATVTSNDHSKSATACASPGTLTVNKQIDQFPTFDVATGHWTISYFVTVTNTDPQSQYYDLADATHFATGVNIVSASATKNGSAIPGWTGLAQQLATGAQLAGGSVGHPVVDEYVVTVVADLSDLTPDSPLLCNGAGTGWYNTATLTTGTLSNDDSACTAIQTPTITHTKAVVPNSVVQAADGTWGIQYTITVNNTGEVGGVYSLDDTLLFGTGITAVTASWAGPDGVTHSWTDPSTTPAQLAVNRPLASGSTEIYTVTVGGITVPAGVVGSPGAGTCPAPGSTDTGAFNNESGLTVISVTTDATACAQPTNPAIVKHFVSAVQTADPAVWTVNYTLTVDNSKGTNSNVYTLNDTPAFASGVTIDGQSVTKGGTNVPWTNRADPIVEKAQIAAGAKDVYDVAFTVTVGTVPNDDQKCTQGGAGHGFFNTAVLTVGADGPTSSACGDITPKVIPPVTPVTPVTPGQMADTGSNVTGSMGISGLLLVLGTLVVFWMRRRRSDGTVE